MDIVIVVIPLKGPLLGMMSAMLVALLLTGGLSGVAAAAEPSNPMDRIRMELGTTTEFGTGSYIAINCTQGMSMAWFGVVYGTEQNPQPITLVGMNLRYLGGAEVVNSAGEVVVSEVPIPIVTVFGQSLFGLIEFDDTGIPTFFGDNYGAGNGLFDFSTNQRMFAEDSAAKYEAVHKYVDLKMAWTLSAIEQGIDYGSQSKSYDFSLYAENVPYSKVWDPRLMVVRNGTPEDGVVERIEFRFHITASATEIVAKVPFYQVKVDNGKIVSSKEIAPRNYTCVSTETEFKYDHILEGWDFDPSSHDPLLMLENGIIYAVFVPDKVEEWYNAQFVADEVDDATGEMTYTTSEGEQKACSNDDLPRQATLLTKDEIVFHDNWERTGALTWVSNVTVDGVEDRTMIYQIHAGEDFYGRGENDDGRVAALFILGGYIYPAGSNIMHDPLFSVSAIQMEMTPEFGSLVVLGLIGLLVVIGTFVGAALMLRHRQKRRGSMRNLAPPPYRP